VKYRLAAWLAVNRPDRKARVLSLMRSMRGGKLNEATFGKRMKGEGPYADLIAQRFRLAVARNGLDRREEESWLRTDFFRPPARNPAQLTLDL